jgi:hypothetical protein
LPVMVLVEEWAEAVMMREKRTVRKGNLVIIFKPGFILVVTAGNLRKQSRLWQIFVKNNSSH